MFSYIVTAALVFGLAQDADRATSQPQAAAAAPSPVRELTVPELLSEADKAAQDGRLNEALRHLQTVLDRDPDNVEANLGMSRIWDSQEDMFRTIQYLQTALEAAPADYRVNVSLGRAYLRSKYWRQAQVYLERAQRLAPAEEAGDIELLLAQAFLGLGRRDEARKHAEEAAKLVPGSFDVWYILADAYYQNQQFDLARQAVDRAARIATELYRREPGNLEHVQRLVQILDKKIEVLIGLHRSLYLADSRGRATDKVMPGQEKTAAALIHQTIIAMLDQIELRRIAELHDTLPLVERMVLYEADNVKYLLLLANVEVQTRQFARALRTYQEVRKHDPTNTEAVEQLRRLRAQTEPQTPASQPAQPVPSDGTSPSP